MIRKLKPYTRWFILGITLFFLADSFKDRVAEIKNVTIDLQGWLLIFVGLIITLLAHVWSGLVWTWILKIFQIDLGLLSGIKIYLVTNIAKYLPGNVWHFYGRITAITKVGNSVAIATLSVVLEPILMAVSALLLAIITTSLGWVKTDFNILIFSLQLISLLSVLIGIHPRILNPIIKKLSKSKNKQIQKPAIDTDTSLKTYPLIPFLGEMGFVLMRGLGFIFTFLALQNISLAQVLPLISAFSIAWLLGLVIPGAPGGIGVFEAMTISLLDESLFPPATVLVSVAIYRVISILAETIAAGFAWGMSQK